MIAMRREEILFVIKLLYETGFKIGDILNLEKESLKKYEYKIINIRSASKI